MDNQEAIKILSELHDQCCQADSIFCTDTTGARCDAVDMAISALQAQDVPDINVGDMISRQKAIDALCSKCTVDKPETCSTIQEGDRWCEEVYTLLNLPSAQSEIIRCKDCKWWSNDDYRECSNPNYDDGCVTPAGFYCGYAERRTNGQVN